MLHYAKITIAKDIYYTFYAAVSSINAYIASRAITKTTIVRTQVIYSFQSEFDFAPLGIIIYS